MARMADHRRAEAVRITSAPSNRADDIAKRQRRYLISMAVRTACVIGAVVVGPGILRWVLVAGAVVLPYVAVIVANTADNRREAYLPEAPGPRGELPPSRPERDR